jgi:hypothetical protein
MLALERGQRRFHGRLVLEPCVQHLRRQLGATQSEREKARCVERKKEHHRADVLPFEVAAALAERGERGGVSFSCPLE